MQPAEFTKFHDAIAGEVGGNQKRKKEYQESLKFALRRTGLRQKEQDKLLDAARALPGAKKNTYEDPIDFNRRLSSGDVDLVVATAVHFILHTRVEFEPFAKAVDAAIFKNIPNNPKAFWSYSGIDDEIISQNENENIYNLYLQESLKSFESKSFSLRMDSSQNKASVDLKFDIFLDIIDDLYFAFGFKKAFISADVIEQSEHYTAKINTAYEHGVELGNAKFIKHGGAGETAWCLSREDGALSGRFVTKDCVASLFLQRKEQEINLSLSIPLGESSICYSDGSRFDSINREIIVKRLFSMKSGGPVGEAVLQKLKYVLRQE